MKKIKYLIVITALAMSVILSGCGASNTVKGGVIGGVAGGVVGGVVGDQLGNTTLGVIIGAAVGGTAGVLIGNHMDKQAEEIENEIDGVTVERVGEGIALKFDSGILFGFDSEILQPQAKENIYKLADILKKYPDSNILIAGHTDSDGAEQYNQSLSERRAKAVSDYTMMQGVSSSRLSIVGLGETEPIATNSTESGKQLNRRVEIAIFANEDLKRAAERGEL
ncbi:MAG TPA: OmpA family protein [Ignavibacteriaceae bacterium]|nr:OmpA family protein [Ignavibacteriaceae bacterium]